MSNVRVVRWRKYGKDRLYVTDLDGVSLGFYDLVADTAHIAIPEQVDDFHAGIQDWRARHDTEPSQDIPVSEVQAAAPPQPVAPAPPEVDESNPPDDGAATDDLAERRAGAMAREQAVALREAAPVRTLLARVVGVHTDERAWRIGADGEEKTAAELNKLVKKYPNWRVLHAVPVGNNGADIDHVAIGPGGVFTLNTKNHPGASIWVGGNTFMVNGQRQPYIRNSRHEAERASRLLTAACGFPVFAQGVVVPVGADKFTMKAPPDDVNVVSRRAIARWLRDVPERLPHASIEAIYAAARSASTWSSSHT